MMTYDILKKVRVQKPLVHHLTNWVTIYDCANITRAFGALPVMAHAVEESGDMAKIASALVLNIGTLTPTFVESMKVAARSANEKGIPVVLDAVGVGATKLRDDKGFELLNEVKISIVKGNASEVARIAGLDAKTKGVESTEVGVNLVELAKNLAKERDVTVVITGKEDIISDGENTFIVKNGHAMMGSIVGTGCMAASVIGCFAAVEESYAKAAAAALACFGIAGEIAAEVAKGPGTFKEQFYDAAYNLSEEQVDGLEKIVRSH